MKKCLNADNRKEIAESLFGILPNKPFYTQKEVEEELGLNREELKNLDDIEFEDD